MGLARRAGRPAGRRVWSGVQGAEAAVLVRRVGGGVGDRAAPTPRPDGEVCVLVQQGCSPPPHTHTRGVGGYERRHDRCEDGAAASRDPAPSLTCYCAVAKYKHNTLCAVGKRWLRQVALDVTAFDVQV